MNTVHDMGGIHGFGPVKPDQNEPVFHARWEGRVLAMNRATTYLGLWNIDINRTSRESLPPVVYLGSSYYQKWQFGMEALCLQYGLIGGDELATGRALHPAAAVKRVLTAADAPKALTRTSFERAAAAPATFKPGDRVRTRNQHPATHTRLPRYARDRCGVVEAIRGCHVFPDSVAAGKGEDPHWLYTVVFEARELWGESADPDLTVSIDAWEPYLIDRL